MSDDTPENTEIEDLRTEIGILKTCLSGTWVIIAILFYFSFTRSIDLYDNLSHRIYEYIGKIRQVETLVIQNTARLNALNDSTDERIRGNATAIDYVLSLAEENRTRLRALDKLHGLVTTDTSEIEMKGGG